MNIHESPKINDKKKRTVQRLVSLAGILLFAVPVGSEARQALVRGTAAVEDVYVVRTVRDSTSGPTDFCAASRTGFDNVRTEDRYSLHSTSTRASDGLIVNASVEVVGSLHACFGRTADPAVANFYGEFDLPGKAFKAKGECQTTRTDYPEPGLTILRCSSTLYDLPAGYVGGQLTTNSLSSGNKFGVETEPRGYVQSSIVTVRLWKNR